MLSKTETNHKKIGTFEQFKIRFVKNNTDVHQKTVTKNNEEITMAKNTEESKDCIKGGYKEQRDPLTDKAKRHSASALKKYANAISNAVAVVPSKELKAKTLPQGEVADFEKKAEDVEIIPDKDKEQFEKSVILRYKDSDNTFLEKVHAYEKIAGKIIPLDYDSDSESFIVSVNDIEKFREFMIHFEEIPEQTNVQI